MPDIAKVVILDTSNGAWQGGHDTDYLNALSEALAPYRPSKLAPYECHVSGTMGRIGRLRLLASGLRELGLGHENCVVVVQSPSKLELLAIAVSSLLFGRRFRPLVVLRRESFHGARWLEFVFRRLIGSLIRGDRWAFASDSHPVLEFWQRQSGRPGSLIAIPERRPPPGWRKAHPGAVTFALLGAMRWEKGAVYYGRLIESCVALGTDCRVIVQCYTQSSDPDLATLGRTLFERWSHHARVQLIGENLSAEEYAALLAETDIGLFPYDVAAYGGGTSGVLHEILAMGKIAVATPIAWAKSAFAQHPNLIFIDDPGADSAQRALGEACRRARAARRGNSRSGASEDRFGQSWRAALSKATSALAKFGSQ